MLPAVRDTEPALVLALHRAIEDPSTRDSLRLFVECRREAGLGSVELFGNGVGIAEGRRQFEVPRSVVEAVIEALRDRGFVTMPESFGGRGEPIRPPRSGGDPGGRSAVRLDCRVELTLDGISKTAVQLAEGFQSPDLRGLALEILGLCEGPARQGVEAADLAEGLAKLTSGRLAPEAFHLILHHRPESPAGGPGFLLRVDGPWATVRAFEPGSGHGPPHRLRLADAELAKLTDDLTRAGVQELPVNLWAESYTDLAVTVLEHRISVQARRFAGLEPSTHGERQRSFDRLATTLTRLAARTLAEGRPPPPD